MCVSAFRSMCKKVAVTQKSAFGKQSQLITAVTLNVHDSRGVTPHVQNVIRASLRCSWKIKFNIWLRFKIITIYIKWD